MRGALVIGAALGLLASCGDPSVKAEGEECVATSECDEGLTCNFGESPPTCRSMQTPVPDAAAAAIDAGPVIDADPGAPDGTPGTPDGSPMIDGAPVIDGSPMIDGSL